MTQQDKDLLLRDLCARLPRGVMIYIEEPKPLDDNEHISVGIIGGFSINKLQDFEMNDVYEALDTDCIIKLFLRPLSSLTQEERDKFCDIGGVISYRPTDGKQYIVAFVPEALDYLNSIHADYRGLIEKGLAIEVTDENNPYK